MKEESEQLLKELTEAMGVPGCEGEVRSIIERHLDGFCEMSRDNLGNIVCRKKGSAERPRVMLPAHMDEIGFMVKLITKEGFVRFCPLGGWWSHVVLAQRVRIYTRKGPVEGIVGSKPPHILPKEEREKLMSIDQMFIDVGASSQKDAEKKLGIRVGDPIVPVAPFFRMAGRRYGGKAWDDRAGIGVMIEAIKRLGKTEHPNTVYGVGTVMEEVGCRGARTAAHVVEPDVCIVLEVGIAGDVPGIKPEEVQGKLGAGPQVCVLDAGMIPNVKLRDFVLDVAEKVKINCQLFALTGGATDGAPVHVSGAGVPTLYVGVPSRHIHSHTGIIDGRDYQDLVRLIVEVVKRLDQKTVESFR